MNTNAMVIKMLLDNGDSVYMVGGGGIHPVLQFAFAAA